MQKTILSVLFLTTLLYTSKAQLTVEKIMQDPKWMGTQPSNVYWSWDSEKIFFSWNPDKAMADSTYSYTLATKAINKMPYKELALQQALANAVYNASYTQLLYVLKGDVYWMEIATKSTIRITQTEEVEFNPKFVKNDTWIVYTKNQNLYAWIPKDGSTLQLTNFSKGAESNNFPTKNNSAKPSLNTQENWLQNQQLQLSTVLAERKNKRAARENFLKQQKDTDTLRTIYIGDKQLQNVQISNDGNYITYRLYAPPTPSKQTIVPDYVTESGFTTDIAARTKVGNNLGKYDMWLYNMAADTLIKITFNNLPDIKKMPDYTKDYPTKFDTAKAPIRNVQMSGPYWNANSSKAFIDIRSLDNKDRWLAFINTSNGSLQVFSHQRDEAWIGGPGISAFAPRVGWINNEVLYFQSEQTGYSHLYTYNTNSKEISAITSGEFEIQEATLNKAKTHFYILANQQHPGKQHWYMVATNGSNWQQITQATGGYDVSLSPNEKHIAYRYSYINQPWELFVQENTPNKKNIAITNKSKSAEFSSYNWKTPEVVGIKAADGETIYARIYHPNKAVKNSAAVFFVHGAGYLQNVHFWWSQYFREYMFNNLLADKGYTVIDIDYRASSGYGRNWRTGIYRFMGGKDLSDHEDAAKYLIEKHGIDSNRIGMYGGSYGGFITLMAMFTKPNFVKAGAALRPVTDWAHYNHGYTSNILNEPFNDSIAYAKSSPINFANGLKNHLLICHGMVDVNVHFQDVVRLSQKLIELGKNNWELAVYPVEDHGFVEPSSWIDEYKRILKLFDMHLLKK
jgi:dipeptidyl aminopeptidase/acylaminoacyl peptidase